MFIPLMFAISFITFLLIQLPPGDYLTTYIARLESAGFQVNHDEIERLRDIYGLDQPFLRQYFTWIFNFIRGRMGRSFATNQLVRDMLVARVPISIGISAAAMILVYVIAIPIGIYSATHQYSGIDYVFTFIGFFGLAVPSFLFALLLMYLTYKLTGHTVTGLFSQAFIGAPWSLAKLADLLKNIWLPLLVLGTAGTAGLIRITRGNLLDELKKQYVVTARAKGVSEQVLLWRYPIRVSFNPIISTVGWMLPALISGEVIVAIVLGLPTVGPLLYDAIIGQDMYLAGSILMVLSALTILGTLISDILLAWIDPRIRYR